MSAKSKLQSPKPAGRRRSQERKCLRCGCTERRACACGCCWTVNSDVCTACLTEGEYAIWTELTQGFLAAATPEAKAVETKQQFFFRTYLNLISKVKPLPRRLTQDFHEELANLKADRKYPDLKPQYAVLHDKPRRRAK